MSLNDLVKKYGGITGDSASPAPFSVSLQGLEGTGKTWFILSGMPLPIVVLNFGDRDPGTLLYRLPEERRKKITVFNLQPESREGWTYQEAAKALSRMGEIMKEAFEDGYLSGGTFAIDGGSRWWRAMQVVFVEPKEKERLEKGLKQIGGLIYEEANLRFDGVMTWLKAQGAYVAITHVLRQDWDAEGPVPGSFSPRQNNQVPFIVEVQLELWKRCSVCRAPFCQQPQHVGRTHVARILKLAANTELEGLEIEDPDFEKIRTLYYG